MSFTGRIIEKNGTTLDEMIKNLEIDPRSGAITTFSGIVRNISDTETKKVVYLEVEAWPERGDGILTAIACRIGKKHDLLALHLVHFTGTLDIGDNIVMVVISSIHRKEAFAALEEVIVAYKNESPVWKKEIYEDGSSSWITTRK